ncbi:MAG: DUF58 domain-containing protein [Anaerolineae bacterium]|nr:DUF58 domain-containing protein [Anaerolineae bacterium]
MPTSRAYALATASAIFYLLGNQTQVGWLYMVSALLLGVVLAAYPLNRGALRKITGERRVGTAGEVDLYEGDETSIELTLRKNSGIGTGHIRLAENCPLAAPDSPQRTTRLFIPSLPGKGAVQFTYAVTLYKRGLHTFPSLNLASGAPFGLFTQTRTLDVPTRTLIYPEVRPLERLDLLDKRLAAEVARPRAGVGYEALGVRPYRTGDSPRHIHWRSVARTGQLISKEFADEAQPGLTLALDLFAYPYTKTESKHTSFEWAVKSAASIADYARQKGYGLHLLADDEALAVPMGPVTWEPLLQYLARVQPTGKRTLPQVIGGQVTQMFVAAILAWPDAQAVAPLLELRNRRIEVLAVLIDSSSFPDGGPSADNLAGELTAAGIDVRILRFSDDWASQLS